MIKGFLFAGLLIVNGQAMAWGFWAHRRINQQAVYLLPPQMMVLYKPGLEFITDHAVDPDKRRYAIKEEAPRHYIDVDHYGHYPYDSLPRRWDSAVARYSNDTLQAHGIVPWWIQTMLYRLSNAFKARDYGRILKLSAEIGHYIADAHVPLHASSNHNGQNSGQTGIHGFWESRLPELFADSSYDFFVGKAAYIPQPGQFIWARVLESGAAADTVLKAEALLNTAFATDRKYGFEERQGLVLRQYSTAYSTAYHNRLNGMVERRMRQSIFAVASFWFTAWVLAGQPDLASTGQATLSEADQREFDLLNAQWKAGGKVLGRDIEQ